MNGNYPYPTRVILEKEETHSRPMARPAAVYEPIEVSEADYAFDA
jgi:hypothetical protein